MTPNPLVQLMHSRGHTYRSLAIAANVDQSTIWRLSRGKTRYPRIETIERLAKTLSTPLGEMLNILRKSGIQP